MRKVDLLGTEAGVRELPSCGDVVWIWMTLLNMQDTRIRRPFGITHGPIRSNSIARSPKQTPCPISSKDSSMWMPRAVANHPCAGFWDMMPTACHNSAGYQLIKPAPIAWIAHTVDFS